MHRSLTESEYVRAADICRILEASQRIIRLSIQQRFVQFALHCHGESVLQNHTPSYKTTLRPYKSVLDHHKRAEFVWNLFIFVGMTKFNEDQENLIKFLANQIM
jgi:hypothetical protein